LVAEAPRESRVGIDSDTCSFLYNGGLGSDRRRPALEHPMMEFEDRVALVTGSARGIGKAVAQILFDDGATVIVADLLQGDVDAACREIAGATDADAAGERIAGFTCDVADPDSVWALFRSIKGRFGRLDILVNNAGITRDGLFARMSLEQWKKVIDVNLTGTYLCCRQGVAMLRKSKAGRIINMSSAAAAGNIGQANYSASKAGVIGLTKTLALELARYDLTVNAVAPGFIDTDMTREVPEAARQHWIERVPAGRAGTAEDIARAVTFLASDHASYLTGEVLEVDGGLHVPKTTFGVSSTESAPASDG
jgi:NAD(P)-dependent dehydrogenase (short-subunit alcohol dehydrogenase family)